MQPQMTIDSFSDQARKVLLETPSDRVLFADEFKKDGKSFYRAVLLLDDKEQYIIFMTPSETGTIVKMKVPVNHVATLIASIFASVRNAEASLTSNMFTFAMKAIISSALPDHDSERVESILDKLLSLARGEIGGEYGNNLLQRFNGLTSLNTLNNNFDPFSVASEGPLDVSHEEEMISFAADEIFRPSSDATVFTVDPETNDSVALVAGDVVAEYRGLRLIGQQIAEDISEERSRKPTTRQEMMRRLAKRIPEPAT